MAAEILTGNWEGALEEMQKLREVIDHKVREIGKAREGEAYWIRC